MSTFIPRQTEDERRLWWRRSLLPDSHLGKTTLVLKLRGCFVDTMSIIKCYFQRQTKIRGQSILVWKHAEKPIPKYQYLRPRGGAVLGLLGGRMHGEAFCHSSPSRWLLVMIFLPNVFKVGIISATKLCPCPPIYSIGICTGPLDKLDPGLNSLGSGDAYMRK